MLNYYHINTICETYSSSDRTAKTLGPKPLFIMGLIKKTVTIIYSTAEK